MSENQLTEIESSVIERYKNVQKEIYKKNEWKRKGHGAMFMGAYASQNDVMDSLASIRINNIAGKSENEILLSIISDSVSGIFKKDISDPDEAEAHVLVSNDKEFFEMDINSEKKIAVSFSDNALEKHLAIVDFDSDFSAITEGDSFDSNPKFSEQNENLIYYDSCGIGFNNDQQFVRYGPRGIFSLNIKSGEFTEVLSDDKNDYIKPYQTKDGALYYIKRPYTNNIKRTKSISDIILMPFKIVWSMIGALYWLSKLRSGKNENEAPNSDVKAVQNSKEKIFLDGNLIELEKTLQQNLRYGEKNPGFVPYSWELIKKDDKGERVIKKGISDYALAGETVICSNGRHLMQLNGDDEIILQKTNFAASILTNENKAHNRSSLPGRTNLEI